MRGLLFTGGLFPAKKYCKKYIENSDFIIAADSGLIALRSFKIKPNLIIGDMDSLVSKEILNDYSQKIVLKFPHDKDFTDTELGLIELIKNGCTKINIIGGGGGRIDHLLGIFQLLKKYPQIEFWCTESNICVNLKENEKLNIQIENFEKIVKNNESIFFNTPISLFPILLLSNFPKTNLKKIYVNSSGIKWPLSKVNWQNGDVSISNRLDNSSGFIEILSGQFLGIFPLQKQNCFNLSLSIDQNTKTE